MQRENVIEVRKLLGKAVRLHLKQEQEILKLQRELNDQKQKVHASFKNRWWTCERKDAMCQTEESEEFYLV